MNKLNLFFNNKMAMKINRIILEHNPKYQQHNPKYQLILMMAMKINNIFDFYKYF